MLPECSHPSYATVHCWFLEFKSANQNDCLVHVHLALTKGRPVTHISHVEGIRELVNHNGHVNLNAFETS